MPAVHLTDRTMILGNAGWHVPSVKANISVAGIDRHGKMVLSEAKIREIPSSEPYAIVSTNATVGVFGASTKIRTKDGTSVKVQKLVNEVSDGTAWFENVLHVPDNVTCHEVLHSLFPITAKILEDKLIIRRRFSEEPDTIPSFVDVVHSSNAIFCIISEPRFATALKRHWPEAVISLGKLLFHDSNEQGERIDLTVNGFLIWYISALRAKKIQYSMSFDSLQHSLYANIRCATEHQSPFNVIKSLFYSGHAAQLFSLEWNDRSWNPVLAGFIAGQ
jgi:hypothetical protein